MSSVLLYDLKSFIDDVYEDIKTKPFDDLTRGSAYDAIVWLHHAMKRGTVELVPIKEGDISMTGVDFDAVNDDDGATA